MTSERAKRIGPGPFKKSVMATKPVGTLFSKVWSAPFVHGVTPLWAQRCQEYWDRIEETYGVVLTDHRNAFDVEPEAGPVIATYAALLLVLPGQRLSVQ